MTGYIEAWICPLSIALSPMTQGHGRLELIPAVSGWEAGHMLERLPVHLRGDIYSYSYRSFRTSSYPNVHGVTVREGNTLRLRPTCSFVSMYKMKAFMSPASVAAISLFSTAYRLCVGYRSAPLFALPSNGAVLLVSLKIEWPGYATRDNSSSFTSSVVYHSWFSCSTTPTLV